MDRYAVETSARFDSGIAKIELDPLGFGPTQTRRYVDSILDRCYGLEFMPHRGTAVMVRGREYRRFRHGGHMIYYHILDNEKRVVIEAVLRGSRDFRRHL